MNESNISDDWLDTDRIRAATFVRLIEVHDTLGSTNDRAGELSGEARIELPALIIARKQSAGRGRGAHTWWAAEGALTFSLIIEPKAFGICTASWPQLSLTTAVAICDALSPELSSMTSGGSDLAIKWPNDVLVDGAKVSGVLIESPGGGPPAKERLIIGVGVNVNNSWRSAPREAGSSGIALCDVSGLVHNLEAVLMSILEGIHRRMLQLADRDAALPATWQRASWLTKKHVEVEAAGNNTTGVCAGIAPDGALLVESSLGTQRIYSGSVRVI